jgi:Ni,Fe-hydrogenase I small subunit
MADPAITSGANSPITELDVLWVTAGLGCDGDTIAMTAATQPSIEDVVMGALPWIPKINFHNPFLAIENGDEFLKPFHLAAEGKLRPFILVVEGSIPNSPKVTSLFCCNSAGRSFMRVATERSRSC